MWVERVVFMDKLQSCANAFNKLLDVEYRFIIGRKGKTVELRIVFSKWDFHHLMGLGKLKDLHIAKKNREMVFNEILGGKIICQSICASRYFPLIENRFAPLACIEQLLDDNRLVFRYNKKRKPFSLIEAEYLLSTPLLGNDIYIFLAHNDNEDSYFCRSFFPKDKIDYSEGQAIYTLLYKEKIYLSTGEVLVQYDRLTPKEANERHHAPRVGLS